MDIFNVKLGIIYVYNYHSAIKDYTGGNLTNNTGEQNRPQVLGTSRSGQVRNRRRIGLSQSSI